MWRDLRPHFLLYWFPVSHMRSCGCWCRCSIHNCLSNQAAPGWWHHYLFGVQWSITSQDLLALCCRRVRVIMVNRVDLSSVLKHLDNLFLYQQYGAYSHIIWAFLSEMVVKQSLFSLQVRTRFLDQAALQVRPGVSKSKLLYIWQAARKQELLRYPCWSGKFFWWSTRQMRTQLGSVQLYSSAVLTALKPGFCQQTKQLGLQKRRRESRCVLG